MQKLYVVTRDVDSTIYKHSFTSKEKAQAWADKIYNNNEHYDIVECFLDPVASDEPGAQLVQIDEYGEVDFVKALYYDGTKPDFRFTPQLWVVDVAPYSINVLQVSVITSDPDIALVEARRAFDAISRNGTWPKTERFCQYNPTTYERIGHPWWDAGTNSNAE